MLVLEKLYPALRRCISLPNEEGTETGTNRNSIGSPRGCISLPNEEGTETYQQSI